uniref:Catenin alpha 2 n=1 Tax=Molossus molossus TaxID=27622 RepID=A0A7J8E160_MOLMO|nr:catenin alpha 2 [Molossus molossus]
MTSATSPIILKWDPKSLEIRTLTVERLLEPLVTQVTARLLALAGLAQRLERQPAVLRDPGSVPAKGTYLGCSLSPALVGCAGGSHSMCSFHIDVSLSFSVPLSPSHST